MRMKVFTSIVKIKYQTEGQIPAIYWKEIWLDTLMMPKENCRPWQKHVINIILQVIWNMWKLVMNFKFN